MTIRSIVFRDDVNDDLIAKAEEIHVSVTWLVNQLCREGLDRAADRLRVTT